MKAGRPFDVTVTLNASDAVQILNSVVYGTELVLNGDRAKTSEGKAVRLHFAPEPETSK